MVLLLVLLFRSPTPTEAPAQVLVAAERSVVPTESPPQMANVAAHLNHVIGT